MDNGTNAKNRRGEDVDESDQTAEVIGEMDAKMVPEIQQAAAVTPIAERPDSAARCRLC